MYCINKEKRLEHKLMYSIFPFTCGICFDIYHSKKNKANDIALTFKSQPHPNLNLTLDLIIFSKLATQHNAASLEQHNTMQHNTKLATQHNAAKLMTLLSHSNQ